MLHELTALYYFPQIYKNYMKNDWVIIFTFAVPLENFSHSNLVDLLFLTIVP